MRRRFSGRREAAIGLGVYAVYLAVRHLVVGEDGRRKAARNAERIVALERRLGIHAEPELQALLLPRRRLVAVLNVAYVTLNVGLTVGWLMRLFRRRDPEFHRFRRAAALATLGAQPAFLFFPTAPPRSLDHFVDTIADVSGFDLDDGLVARLYHPLAAMPSIHITYAVITAAGIAQTSRSPLARALAPAYPPAVAFVIFVTANHYVLDALAGAALGLAGLRLARALE
ncbi:MAG TPA: phosphatase PAP2 family protein [Gaiellaceae bacterium]|nr:phosphatase PAP2 family protein [Gaiellaceae bacterium]